LTGGSLSDATLTDSTGTLTDATTSTSTAGETTVAVEQEPTEDITTELVKLNPYRYAGYYWDRKTQYYYLQARYYDPRNGRFLSADTYRGEIDSPLTLNLYTYVQNNPINYVDPSGHKYCLGSLKEGLGCVAVIIGTWLIHNSNMTEKVADFLVVDDIKTIIDPNSSTFDKTLAASNFVPIGKFIKGGRIIVRLINDEGRVIERAVEGSDEALNVASQISSKTMKHYSKHIPSEFAKQVPHLSKEQLESILKDRTFFNPNWSVDEVNQAVQQTYKDALKNGVHNSYHTIEVNGEKITVFVGENGDLNTAFGS
ncbi:RHS repeat-associated core domain-containing protein, partial [Ferviditalea candida]|nr:RHS repeat-associated core domain-containing protein [Paenibacillaceae bacterium T2]